MKEIRNPVHSMLSAYLLVKSVFKLVKINSIFLTGVEFYRARRSLVFAEHLRKAGNMFRMKHLKSNDEVKIHLWRFLKWVTAKSPTPPMKQNTIDALMKYNILRISLASYMVIKR